MTSHSGLSIDHQVLTSVPERQREVRASRHPKLGRASGPFSQVVSLIRISHPSAQCAIELPDARNNTSPVLDGELRILITHRPKCRRRHRKMLRKLSSEPLF